MYIGIISVPNICEQVWSFTKPPIILNRASSRKELLSDQIKSDMGQHLEFLSFNFTSAYIGSTSSISITSGLSQGPMGGPFLGRVWPERYEIRSATLKLNQFVLHLHFEEPNSCVIEISIYLHLARANLIVSSSEVIKRSMLYISSTRNVSIRIIMLVMVMMMEVMMLIMIVMSGKFCTLTM